MPDVTVELGKRSAWWRTRNQTITRQLYSAFTITGSKYMRDRTRDCPTSPITMASDVIACLEYRHKLFVEIVEVSR